MASNPETPMQRLANKLLEEGRVHISEIEPECNKALGELLARGWVEENGDWLTPGPQLERVSNLGSD